MRHDHTRRLITRYLMIGIAVSAMLAVVLWYWLSRSWTLAPWLAAWLTAINVVSFGFYGWDKSCARSGNRRVPELTLHGLALAGGTIGAYVGMRWFRHKTLKGRFRVVFWLITAIHAALVALAVKELLT